jgi:surface polysaccharide O-acyltransferase-like enzyme
VQKSRPARQQNQKTGATSGTGLHKFQEAGIPVSINKKSKIFELDLVRAFAILAVLLIHCTASGTLDQAAGSAAQFAYIAIDKLSNFAVPVFLMISGLVLFYRYFDFWQPGDALRFYRKRLQFIVAPYLIWSAVYYSYNLWMYRGGVTDWNWADFYDQLLWGEAEYHLYFIAMIVQFYALLPLMIVLARRFAGFARHLFLIGLVVQTAGFSYDRWIGEIPHLSHLCLEYFAIFCLGGQIGMNYKAFADWLERNIGWVAWMSGALGCTLAGAFQLEAVGLDFNQVWFALLFNGYAVFAGFALIQLSRRILIASPQHERLPKLLTSLGAASFGIYFLHPVLLDLWRLLVYPAPGTVAYHFANIAAFLVILSIPWGLVLWLRQKRYAWVVIGK